LADPWVVDAPRLSWFLVRNLFVLPRRPRRLAPLYRAIWTDEGSPLDANTGRQAKALQLLLEAHLDVPVTVGVGMRYGRPSIPAGLRSLRDAGCDRMLIMPLFPQYSGTTTGSVLAVVAQEIDAWQEPPETKNVFSYHVQREFLESLANSVREVWEAEGPAERLLISFHGLPERYALRGDPYPAQCRATAEALAALLGLDARQWAMCFQSRFGREAWIQPYLTDTLTAWGREGLGSVDVLCPGFAADCLETLEEVAVGGRRLFESEGGGRFRYVSALNDRSDHVHALAAVSLGNLGNWI
jgi:ferrochelatase